MLEESAALARLLALVPPATAEVLPLEECLGRFALADYFATLPLPSFANSAMDGYALHAADCGPPGLPLIVSGAQPAGPDLGLAVRPGHCVRLFTGAPLPRDAAAVVMQEDTLMSPDGTSISLTEAVAPGEFIRHRGADLSVGQRLLATGQAITPARLGLLASQGLAALTCGVRPRAAVLTTGDELCPPGPAPLAPGQIYDSNGPMLRALLQEVGCRASAHHAPDELTHITETAQRLLAENDILVFVGGVSVGDHDLVKPALAELGIPLEFWRVRLKPGKPFLFTTHQGKLIFGLPGNPVSAFVTALLFLLPACRKLAGAAAAAALPRRTPATLCSPISNNGDRPHYLRGLYQSEDATFTPLGLQQSHALTALAQGNALLRLDPYAAAPAGSFHPVILL